MNKFKLSQSSSIALDLIRSLSSQIVLIGHGMVLFGIFPSKESLTPLYLQNFGVLVFFILSGFLISYSTFNKFESPNYVFLTYFTDRFVRIYVAYLPILVLIFLFDYFIFAKFLPNKYGHFQDLNIKTFVGNLFMLQDFQLKNLSEFTKSMSVTSLGSARPLWTLALEWWFYMFFGWLVFYNKIKLNVILKVGILLSLSLIPLINILLNPRGNCLGAIWFLGCLIYLLSSNGFLKTISIKKTLLILLVLIILLFFRVNFNQNEFYDFRIGFLTAAIIFFVILLFQNLDYFKNKNLNLIIKRTSDYSFTLYLIHYSILDFYHFYFTNNNKWFDLIITLIMCNLIAFLIAFCTEFKHKKLRKLVFNKLGI